MTDRKRFASHLETRTTHELRAVDEEGVFEGYIAVWDTVDAYESTFKRGAFAKTIQERGDKVKVYYNHDALIGRSLEIREDEHGVFVRGKLSLGVQQAADVFTFLRDGTLTGLSFGFQVIKEAYQEGVRQIQEVRLFEYGPVDFPANDKALITGYRAERLIAGEARAMSFAETLDDATLRSEGYRMFGALDETLSDIWWSEEANRESVVALVDEAIADFHAAYLEWAKAFIARFWPDNEARAVPAANELASQMAEYLSGDGRSLESIAANTSLTVDELRTLRRGRLIEHREKLADLPASIAEAHQFQRATAVETLCAEIRGGLKPAEKRRLLALLQPADNRQSENEDERKTIAYLRDFRNRLGAPHA